MVGDGLRTPGASMGRDALQCSLAFLDMCTLMLETPSLQEPGYDTKNPWARIIGPCYTTASLARVLG